MDDMVMMTRRTMRLRMRMVDEERVKIDIEEETMRRRKIRTAPARLRVGRKEKIDTTMKKMMATADAGMRTTTMALDPSPSRTSTPHTEATTITHPASPVRTSMTVLHRPPNSTMGNITLPPILTRTTVRPYHHSTRR